MCIDMAANPDFHHLFYGNPSDRDVKWLAQWLKSNPDTEVQLYHGSAAINPIAVDGLKKTSATRRNSLQSSSGFVYLSVFPGMAAEFGRYAALNRGPDQEGFRVAVYSVFLRIAELLPDKDQLANQRHYAERYQLGNSLAESLIFGRGARFKGNIDPRRIKLTRRLGINESF